MDRVLNEPFYKRTIFQRNYNFIIRLESDWIVGTEQPSFSGSLVLSMSAATNPNYFVKFLVKKNWKPHHLAISKSVL